MRLFFDMEFTGLHQEAQPISIGIVSENEQSFYGEFTDFDRSQIDEWLRKNVLDKLWMYRPVNQPKLLPANLTYRTGTRFELAIALASWLGQFRAPVEMWADVPAYDWVIFCQLFGGATKIPDHLHYIPCDLAMLLKLRGHDPDIDRVRFADLKGSEELEAHNALHDAMILRACYRKLAAVTEVAPAGYVARLVQHNEV